MTVALDNICGVCEVDPNRKRLSDGQVVVQGIL